MKNILHISMIPPSRIEGGGGMGIYQSSRGLQAAGNVDYCGPLPDESCRELEKGYRRIFPIQYQCNLFAKMRALLHLAPSNAYASFAKTKRKLDKRSYDIAYIDASRQGYAAKYAKKHGMRVAIRMHNIERDYYEKMLSLSPSFFMHLKYKMCCYQERRSLHYADTIIFITEEDRMRAEQLYPKELIGKQLRVMPICLEKPVCKNLPRPIEGDYALVTGSLWFGPNLEGILWFLKEVWPVLAERFPHLSLVIAGNKPSQELRAALDAQSRVILIDSPADMAPYFCHASLYLAPVLDGAGMKVKIAEALSYGLPIIGTPHVFIGYRDLKGCTAIANTSTDFIEKASGWLKEGFCPNIRKEARATFCRHYSMENACHIIADILESI